MAKKPVKSKQPKAPKKKKNSALANIRIRKSKEFLIENLALLLDSGLDMGMSLESLQRSSKSKHMKEMLHEVINAINVGSPLWRAIKDTALFPDHICAIIKSGEESGRLPEVLRLVTEQLDRARQFKSKLRSALLYPAFVIGIAVIILTLSFTFTIPKLAESFKSSGLELPLPTRMLIYTGDFLTTWGVIFIPALFLILGILFYLGFVNNKTKYIGQGMLIRTPIIRSLIEQVELSRMGYVLGNLLEAGFTPHESLRWLKEASSFEAYKKLYSELQEKIGAGNSFERSFSEIPKIDKLIPEQYQQFIIAAELSGNLSKALVKMGERFNEKIDITSKNITVALEPILLMIVGAFVFFIALAIFLPIYNLVGSI